MIRPQKAFQRKDMQNGATTSGIPLGQMTTEILNT